MTAEKFEKLAEIKANFDVHLKRLKADKHADKIAVLKEKKEKALQECKEEMDAAKAKRVAQIEEETEIKKKELHKINEQCLKDLRAKSKQSRNRSRLGADAS